MAQPPSKKLEIAAVATGDVSMMLEQMALEMEEKLQREIDEVDGMKAWNNDYISKIESSYMARIIYIMMK